MCEGAAAREEGQAGSDGGAGATASVRPQGAVRASEAAARAERRREPQPPMRRVTWAGAGLAMVREIPWEGGTCATWEVRLGRKHSDNAKTSGRAPTVA